MRMLLTSAGLTNDEIRAALADLVGKPYGEASVAVVVTASLGQGGDHGWFVEALEEVRDLGWRQLDILDLDGPPRDLVIERLREADVVWATGGSQYHLALSVVRNELVDVFRELVEEKVYVGTSAGSMIFSIHFDERLAALLDETPDLRALGVDRIEPPLPLLDFAIKPHLGAPYFPERDDAWADRLAAESHVPIYLLDDGSAIRVRAEPRDPDGSGAAVAVDVVSGTDRWRLVGPPR